MAQFARPDSNVTLTNITGGFADIDEASASDADFAYSANNTTATLEVGLTNPTDPLSSSGHIFRFRYAKTNAGTPDSTGNDGTLTVALMQGATQIAATASLTVSSATWTAGSLTLSAAEADAITDYTDLRLRFSIVGGAGSPANRRGVGISWAELEVPTAALTQSLAGSLSFAGAIAKQTGKALAAALGFTGAITKQTSRALLGALSFAGALTKRTDRSVEGGVTFSGVVVKTTSKSPSGTLTFTASLDPQLLAPGTPALVIIHIHAE